MMFRIAEPFKWMAAALLGLGVVAGIALWMNQGSHLRVEGSILKARVVSTDDNAAVIVVDFRVKNPAAVPLVVRDATLVATLDDGSTVTGMTAAEIDLDRMLESNKMIGPRYNPSLKIKERLAGGAQTDRTLAASFTVSAKRLESRKNLVVRIEDVDGPMLEIAEKKGQ